MISFIVPVYNGERFLHACADSILGQSTREIEVIFINDGSKDGSQAILAEYAAKDARVRVIEQANQGVSAARNCGIDEAKGEYLWFFDCDDVLHAGAAEKLLACAEETGADLVAASFGYLHEKTGKKQTVHLPLKDGVLQGDARSRAIRLSALGGCKLWRADVIRSHHLRYPPYRIAEDVGFYLCALACCARVATLDLPVYDYRVYDGSNVQRVTLKALDCIAVFDEADAFYRARGESKAFQSELLFGRMFHYLLWLERLPRLEKKSERRQVEGAFEQSRRRQDFSAVADQMDIMTLVNRFDARIRRHRWYESHTYAALYRTARRIKRLLKR